MNQSRSALRIEKLRSDLALGLPASFCSHLASRAIFTKAIPFSGLLTQIDAVNSNLCHTWEYNRWTNLPLRVSWFGSPVA
jgi:hypothetical protein